MRIYMMNLAALERWTGAKIDRSFVVTDAVIASPGVEGLFVDR